MHLPDLTNPSELNEASQHAIKRDGVLSCKKKFEVLAEWINNGYTE